MNTNFLKVNDEKALESALKLAKGNYQRGLLEGYYRLSGADLQGEAKKWGASYARSRQNLLVRMKEKGIKYSFETGKYNRKVLVIG